MYASLVFDFFCAQMLHESLERLFPTVHFNYFNAVENLGEKLDSLIGFERGSSTRIIEYLLKKFEYLKMDHIKNAPKKTQKFPNIFPLRVIIVILIVLN